MSNRIQGFGRKVAFIYVLLCSCKDLSGQLIVYPDSVAQSLVNIISAPGMIISNATVNAEYPFTGSFNCPYCNLGLPSGIILSTDSASCAQGPNTDPYYPISPPAAWPGDSDLSKLAGIPSSFWNNGYCVDASVLEFDVIPLGDTLRFKFVFASEEYPEFVCSTYDDVMGIFATGPNPAGGSYNKYNFALTPGTNLPVSINTINDGHTLRSAFNNCPATGLDDTMYYVNNGFLYYPLDTPVMPAYQIDPYYIQYNGFTTPLDAIIPVVPCQVYHMKFGIEDIDAVGGTSAVFIQAGSLTSTLRLYIDTVLYDQGYSSAVAGCIDGQFEIKLLPAQSQPYTVHYALGGTAINGVNYNLIPDSIVIPAGDTVGYVSINGIQGITDSLENVRLYLLNSVCGAGYIIDSADLDILQKIPVHASPDTTKCPLDTVQLMATGGTSYSWSPSAGLNNTSIDSPLCTGFGQYIVTGTLGTCTATDTVNISERHFILPYTVDSPKCFGDSVTVSIDTTLLDPIMLANGPLSYEVNGTLRASDTLICAPNQANPIEVINARGCLAQDTVDVTAPAQVTIALVNKVTPLCYMDSNGSIIVQAGGGSGTAYTYSWSNSQTSDTDTAIPTGTYQVTVTDQNLCTASASYDLSQPDSIILMATVSASGCIDAPQYLIIANAIGGTGGFTYSAINSSGQTLATNNSDSLKIQQGGTIVIKAVDSNGCTAAINELMPTISRDSFNLQITNVSCNSATDGVLTITALSIVNAPYQYSIDGSPFSPASQYGNLQPGTHTITAQNVNGCDTTFTFQIGVTPIIFGDSFILQVTNVSCFNDSDGQINITALAIDQGPYQYSFGSLPFSSNGQYSGLASGSYNVTVQNANGCDTVLTFQIANAPQYSLIVMPQDSTIGLGSGVQLAEQISPSVPASVSYEWTPSDGLSCTACPNPIATPTQNINQYILTIHYDNNCILIDTLTIYVVGDHAIYIPDAFTPNSDGINDYFQIFGKDNIQQLTIKIFDRWGEKVFESEDIDFTWDGRYRGELEPTGVYVYICSITFSDQHSSHFKGSITLIR